MKTKKKTESEPTPLSKQLKSFLKENEKDHFNYVDEVNYTVSTGSLQLDFLLNGGLKPGVNRYVGMNEGGKTSAALAVMKNFLETVPNSIGIFIKAEGRLSKEIIERSGVNLVKSEEEVKVGSCFVFSTNIYEAALTLVDTLVKDNPNNHKYMIIIDSIDGLIRRDDLHKSLDDSSKVAGGAVVASDFCKKSGIPLAVNGHLLLLISQVRADIKIDPYSKAPVRQTTATGGNALLHITDVMLQFEPRWKQDDILENDRIAFHEVKNPRVGHYCRVSIKKCPTENTGTTVRYPIKYGQTGGKSIWTEKEIYPTLLSWEYLVQKGAWLFVSEDFKKVLEGCDIQIPDKFQGEKRFFEHLQDNPDLSKVVCSHFLKILSGDDIDEALMDAEEVEVINE